MSEIVYYTKSQIEKNSHFYLNITNNCSSDCVFCIRKTNPLGFQGLSLKLETEPTIQEIIDAVGDEIKTQDTDDEIKLVFCGYGEPSIRYDTLLRVSKILNEDYNVNIRVNTNAQGFVNRWLADSTVIQQIKYSGIDCLSISLNAESSEKYKAICQPKTNISYKDIIDFISTSKKEELDVIVTFVDYGKAFEPNFNRTACEELALRMGVPYEFREYTT